jgi:hypothetical protein
MDNMFNRFGIVVEIFINQSMEFHENFQKLHEKTLIDHRMTSWDLLKAYKLAENMVWIVKWGILQKYGHQKGQIKHEELQLSWLGVGYRFS